ERGSQVMGDVGEELRLELVARTQIRHLFQRGPELMLQGREPLLGSRGAHVRRQHPRLGIDSRHVLVLPSADCANSISSLSSSIASSNCCRFNSDQYRPPAANNSSWRPCSTIRPPSSTTIQLASRMA